MELTALPQDIVLLLCEELAARRDFGTLFHCSLVSRRIASIALEQIYSIQELSPASTGDAYSKLEWSRLWRSIILSSIGKAAYPYCAYVRALSLGNLEECIQDMGRDRDVRDFFFGGAMEQFLVLREGHRPVKNTRNAPLPFIDARATTVKCADSITEYIKKSADDTGVAISLAHLEGTSIPHDILPTWISRLGTLTSLRIRDGSVLGVEAANAIRECCPHFVDLTLCRLFDCLDQSSTADEDLAAFFQALRPNSLRSFEVISQNAIGDNALTALNAHAASLRSLMLGSLPSQAMKALNLLPNCTALETLSIENEPYSIVRLADHSPTMLKEVSMWICNCKSLRDLSFTHVQDAALIVKDVLSSPDIRLKSLCLLDFYEQVQDNTDTWNALGLQEHLEALTLGFQDGSPVPGLTLSHNQPLVYSICQLENLRSLNLMQSYCTVFEVQRFARALPKLSEFSFSGATMNDMIFESLGALPQLKLLCINAISAFTYEGLREFSRKLRTPDHIGIRVDILNQMGEIKLRDSEYERLQEYFRDKLKGRFEMTYHMDPDELPDVEYSDISD